MSMPEQFNPYDSPETVKPGMSTGAKVLLGLGIGCGVLVLLCCGGGAIAIFMFGRSIEQAASNDPEVVRRVTSDVVDITIPEPLQPTGAIDKLSIPFVGAMTMAMWADKVEEESNSGLFLFQLDSKAVTREALKAQFEMQLQQSGEDWEEVDLENSETIEKEINGSAAEFKFGFGKVRGSEREVWQCIGAFDGKGGPAMIFMQLDAQDFTEEQARGIIDSMK